MTHPLSSFPARHSIQAAPGPCILEAFACSVDEGEPGYADLQTLPCGHRIHSLCLLDYLLTSCLGFATGGGTAQAVAVVGSHCPAKTAAFEPACWEPIPWLELLDKGFFAADTDKVSSRGVCGLPCPIVTSRYPGLHLSHLCPR